MKKLLKEHLRLLEVFIRVEYVSLVNEQICLMREHKRDMFYGVAMEKIVKPIFPLEIELNTKIDFELEKKRAPNFKLFNFLKKRAAYMFKLMEYIDLKKSFDDAKT